MKRCGIIMKVGSKTFSLIMRKNRFYLSLIILFVASCISLLGILGTSVSIKFEANDGCISEITGHNLCLILVLWEIGFVLTGLSFIGIIIWRKKSTKS